MKRKRGRPKGSTKKPSAEEELAETLVRPSEDSLLALTDGSGLAAGSLECSKCCRKFSNARQLRKHVCIIVLNLGEDEGEAGKCALRPDASALVERADASHRCVRGQSLPANSTCLYKSHPSGKVLRFVVIMDRCCE